MSSQQTTNGLDLTSSLQIRLMMKEIECETLKQKVQALESNPLSFLKHERWDDSSHNMILQQQFQHLLIHVQQLESEIESKNRRIDMLEFSLNNKKKRRGADEDLNDQSEKLLKQKNLIKAFLKRRNQQDIYGSVGSVSGSLSSAHRQTSSRSIRKQ